MPPVVEGKEHGVGIAAAPLEVTEPDVELVEYEVSENMCESSVREHPPQNPPQSWDDMVIEEEEEDIRSLAQKPQDPPESQDEIVAEEKIRSPTPMPPNLPQSSDDIVIEEEEIRSLAQQSQDPPESQDEIVAKEETRPPSPTPLNPPQSWDDMVTEEEEIRSSAQRPLTPPESQDEVIAEQETRSLTLSGSITTDAIEDEVPQPKDTGSLELNITWEVVRFAKDSESGGKKRIEEESLPLKPFQPNGKRRARKNTRPLVPQRLAGLSIIEEEDKGCAPSSSEDTTKRKESLPPSTATETMEVVPPTRTDKSFGSREPSENGDASKSQPRYRKPDKANEEEWVTCTRRMRGKQPFARGPASSGKSTGSPQTLKGQGQRSNASRKHECVCQQILQLLQRPEHKSHHRYGSRR